LGCLFSIKYGIREVYNFNAISIIEPTEPAKKRPASTGTTGQTKKSRKAVKFVEENGVTDHEETNDQVIDEYDEYNEISFLESKSSNLLLTIE
jgi:hypothetical protein